MKDPQYIEIEMITKNLENFKNAFVSMKEVSENLIAASLEMREALLAAPQLKKLFSLK